MAIDQGNTSAKVFIFSGNDIVESRRYNELSVNIVDDYFARIDISGVIVSSVQNVSKELINHISNYAKQLIILDENTPMPMTIEYRSPKKLGRDRIAAAVGAMTIKPDSDLLIIDAGTAITIDSVDCNGKYLGGNISPGMTIRFKALNDYTSKLPIVSNEGDIPDTGYDTDTAIRAGVVLGILYEIEGYIERQKAQTKDLTVFITGGDSHFLAERIKNPIFEVETLLAIGLNRILLYNENI